MLSATVLWAISYRCPSSSCAAELALQDHPYAHHRMRTVRIIQARLLPWLHCSLRVAATAYSAHKHLGQMMYCQPSTGHLDSCHGNLAQPDASIHDKLLINSRSLFTCTMVTHGLEATAEKLADVLPEHTCLWYTAKHPQQAPRGDEGCHRMALLTQGVLTGSPADSGPCCCTVPQCCRARQHSCTSGHLHMHSTHAQHSPTTVRHAVPAEMSASSSWSL